MGRRRIDASAKHAAKEPRIALAVRARRRFEVSDGTIREERRQHRSDRVDLQGDAGVARRRGQPDRQARTELRERRVKLRRQTLEAPEPRGHRQRIARQGARLIHGAGRRYELHQVRASPVRAYRKTAADDFAQTGKVRAHAGQCLRPSGGGAKTRDHLIENQQRTGLCADLAQAGEESLCRGDDSHVSRNRLDDDRGNLIGVSVERSLHRREIVVGRYERVGRRGARHTGAGGCPERQRAGAGLDQERVRVSVIAAFEFQDPIALRGGSRDAQRAHRGFGARAHEAHSLERWHQRPDTLAELDLERAGRPEAGAEPGRRGQRSHESPRRVAVDERSPRHHIIDVAIAVDVLDVRASGAANEQRGCADALEGAHGTVDATGQNLLGAPE